MESLEQGALYVTDPTLTKETITSFISYTLKGTKISEPLNRRYRDFDYLRSKFIERWPGVFIPNIPHKKTVGANDKEIVDLRIEMINRFCSKISSIDYLINSDEMNLFLQNSNDVGKTLNSLPTQKYSDLLKKYLATFRNFDENFDIAQGKENQAKFLQITKAAYPRIRAFRELIRANKEKFKTVHDNYLLIINMFSVYEKDTVKEYCKNDENKLVLFNIKNTAICKNLSKVQDKIVNPYEKLYDSITEDMLDTEAMVESLESLAQMQETLEKMKKTYNACVDQLADLKAGKSNFKSIFSFKSRESDINACIEEKEALEKDIDNLTQIIKIASFNMDYEISQFKKNSLEVYYQELSKLGENYEENNKLNEDLWNSVMADKNLQNIH